MTLERQRDKMLEVQEFRRHNKLVKLMKQMKITRCDSNLEFNYDLYENKITLKQLDIPSTQQ